MTMRILARTDSPFPLSVGTRLVEVSAAARMIRRAWMRKEPAMTGRRILPRLVMTRKAKKEPTKKEASETEVVR